MKAAEALRNLSEFLKNKGVEDSGFEAEQLLAAVLKAIPSSVRLGNPELRDSDLKKLQSMADCRAEGYPLQYLIGEWEFFGLPFSVGEGVLIPRPDTEVLVETALGYISGRKNLKIIDLCSGSGCIAVALSKHTENCEISALEKEPKAYEYLKKNVELNQVDVATIKGDIINPFGSGYDLIVSNPPYITAEAMNELQKEVTFEPDTALRGGEDGLLFYRLIVNVWTPLLKSGGMLAVEIGFDQREAVTDIFGNVGFKGIKCIKDYGGNDRVIVGTKP